MSVVLNNVSKTFYNGKQVAFELKNISFSLPSKGLCLLYGQSGSGKSTLLNLISGLDYVDKGSLKVFGYQFKKHHRQANLKYRNALIGILFQHFHLFEEETVEENLKISAAFKLPSKDISNRIDTLLNQFKLTHLKDQKCHTLSGGEKQRVAFLRAIIHKPPLLLCDEPTGDLDEENSYLILSYLKEYAKTHLVVVVSHNLKLFKNDSNIILHLSETGIKKEKDNLPFKNEEKISVKSSLYKNKSWKKYFKRKYFKKYKKRQILALLSSTFGLVFAILLVGLNSSASTSFLNLSATYFHSDTFNVSKKEYITMENSPVSISRSYRPNFEELEIISPKFDEIIFDYDLSSLFLPNQKIKLENIEFDVSLSPTKTLLKEDDYFLKKLDNFEDSYNSCVINEIFYHSLIEKAGEEVLGKSLKFNIDQTISFHSSNEDNATFEEHFIFQEEVMIVGVAKESPILNDARVYLSYDSLKEYAQNNYAINYSSSINEDVSFYDLIKMSSNFDPLSSYQMIGFINVDELDTLNTLDKEFKSEENEEFAITSFSLLSYDVYMSFIDIAILALFGFIALAILSSAFIIAMTSFATFLDEKKEAAILSVLGAKDEDIESIFVDEKINLAVFTATASIILSLVLSYLANVIVKMTLGIDNFLSIPFLSYLGYPFLLILIIYLGSILVCYLSVKIPLFYHRKNPLYMELAEE